MCFSEISIFLQTVAAVTHLSEGLTLARCRASNTGQCLINLVDPRKLTALKMEK